MTAPTSQSPPWNAWAAEQLGVTPEATAAESCKAFLAKLEQTDLVPAGELRAALQIKMAAENFTEPCGRALINFRKSHDREVHDAVARFANDYWNLAPAQRQLTYDRLLAQAEHVPGAKLRLEKLRAGLTIEAVDDSTDEPIHSLAKTIQEIYVLDPMNGAVRRHELVVSLSSESDAKALLRLLGARYPKIAALEANLETYTMEAGKKRNYVRLKKSKLLDLDPTMLDETPIKPISRTSTLVVFVVSTLGMFIIIGVKISFDDDFQKPFSAKNLTQQNLNRLIGAHLRVVTNPDGSTTVEVVDKNGNTLQVGEATKRLMGSKELLEKYRADLKANGSEK